MSDVIAADICVFVDIALASDVRMLACACNNVSINYNNYSVFTHCNKMKRLFSLKESLFTSSFICHFCFHLLQFRVGCNTKFRFFVQTVKRRRSWAKTLWTEMNKEKRLGKVSDN